MKKSVTLGIIFVLLLMPTIMAMNINVKTWPEHTVTVSILAGSDDYYSLLDEQTVKTGPTGIAIISYAGSDSEIKVTVKVTKDEEYKFFYNFGKFPTTEDLYIQAIRDQVLRNYKPLIVEEVVVENVTEENGTVVEEALTEVVQEETIGQQDSGLVVGFAVAENLWKDYSNILYYVLAGIVAVGLIIFTIAEIKKHRNGPYLKYNLPEDKARELDEIKLTEAEEQIKKAQEMIKEVKDREIKKKKFEEAQKEYEEAKAKLADLEKE